MLDVIARSALDQSALLRRGELSVVELTRAYLDRIERLDRRLSAFAEFAPDGALAAAAALDQARRRDPHADRSTLWGLPTGLKDLHLTRGLHARMGTRALRWLWSPIDDATSAAVRRAGLVITGKLSTSELAILPFVDVDLHPPTRNPWDETRYSGGSSGGSSAAIAAGMIPVSAASDGAGSIRIPAAFCGLVGHKPTRGLVDNPHGAFDRVGLSVIGPHARSVDDAAAFMDVLLGARRDQPSFLEAIRRPPPPLRLRYVTQNPITTVDPEIAAAVERTARAAEALGHHVEQGEPLAGTLEEFLPMFHYLIGAMFIPFAGSLQASTRHLRAVGRQVRLADALARRDDFTRRVDAASEGADVWITPTVPHFPPRVGAYRDTPPARLLDDVAHYGAFTAVFNASGNPATSIPVGTSAAGLPISVQLVGARGADRQLLSLARQLTDNALAPIAPAL